MRPDVTDKLAGLNQQDNNQKPFEDELFRLFQHVGLLLNQKQTQEINTMKKTSCRQFSPVFFVYPSYLFTLQRLIWRC